MGCATYPSNCSSLALKSISRALPSTWSSDADRQVRDGVPSTQPCTGYRNDGSVRGPDRQIQPALSQPGPQRADLDQCDAKPDGGMDKSPTDGSFQLGGGPCYLMRDRDSIYGDVFTRRLRGIGIRDRPTAPRSPWQNGYCERLIGSIRRECLDYVVIFGERHLRHPLRLLQSYPNAPILGQGFAGVARHRVLRWHIAFANSGRIAPPIRQNLVSDRDRYA